MQDLSHIYNKNEQRFLQQYNKMPYGNSHNIPHKARPTLAASQ
jgi:hypothetical protein